MIRRVHSARGVSRKLVSQCQCKQWEVNNPTCICSAEPRAAAFIPGDRFWSHYCCSVTQSCMTLCDPVDYSTPGSPDLQYPSICSNSCPLSWWCHPITLSSVTPFSSCPQSFDEDTFQWVSSWHQVAKVLEFQQQSFQWIFRIDFL